MPEMDKEESLGAGPEPALDIKQRNVHVSGHPLVATKLSILRDPGTDCKLFRSVASELALLLGYEATADLSIIGGSPLGTGHVVSTNGCSTATANGTSALHAQLSAPVAIVPIMRAGLGLLDSFLHLLPTAAVFHLGIFREPQTLRPIQYYSKLPRTCTHSVCIVLDAMVATGGTAAAAVKALREWGAERVKVVALCASRSGIETVVRAWPDVQLYVGAIDEGLSPDGYIVPGLGDAGDRLYRTK